MNRRSILLNNLGVVELQDGNIIKAFDLFSKSSNLLVSGFTSQTHINNSKIEAYRYNWVDCNNELLTSKPSHLTWEGSLSFLFIRSLRVTILQSDEYIDESCPCGFAWAVWFNLAICCSLIGTRLGEKGERLLKIAFELYKKVQHSIQSESPSRHRSILQMAIMNNQACIFRDFAMHEKATTCLQKLTYALFVATDMHVDDWKTFSLNLQILGAHVNAGAA